MTRASGLRTAVLGAATGLRTFMAPLILSQAASRGRLSGLEDTRYAFLASTRSANVLAVLELGELIGDKLPFAPSRTAGGAFVGRLVSGAVSGAALRAAAGRGWPAGAALAGGAAVAAAYAGEYYRGLGQKAGLPDPVLALLEDAAAVGLALLAVGDS